MNVFMLHCWEETKDISGNLREVFRVFQDESMAKSAVLMLFSSHFERLKADSNATIMAVDMDLYDHPTASIIYEQKGIMDTPETWTYWIRVMPILIE